MRMLRDIRACVEDESATGPWYAVRHSPTRFAIFEAFPDIAGRDDTSREKAATSSVTSSGPPMFRRSTFFSKRGSSPESVIPVFRRRSTVARIKIRN